MHATTILSVRKGGDVVVIGDGQVTLGATVVKPNARKVRVIGGGKVIAGFAGSTADCFALLEQLEKKLDEYPGQLLRASVELAKMWRTDKFLRHLEAWVVAVDKDTSITLTGNGDVLSQPDSGVVGIGSGGLYAVSAARALVDIDGLSARDVAIRAMEIASDVCIYTNKSFVVESFEQGTLMAGKDKAEREQQDKQRRDSKAQQQARQKDEEERKHIAAIRSDKAEGSQSITDFPAKNDLINAGGPGEKSITSRDAEPASGQSKH